MCGNNVSMLLRNCPAIAIALAVLSLTLGACVTKNQAVVDPSAAVRAAEAERQRAYDERTNEVMDQLAMCESGGVGPTDKKIFGARGLYHGRFQFAPRTVMIYVQKRDGVGLNAKEASELAHDWEKSRELAKYMIFDLHEPWHWPLCSRKIKMPAQIAAIRQAFPDEMVVASRR